MPQCRILIADDEQLARSAIKLALPPDDTLRIVAECTNGEEALARTKEYLPDILFLDIRMPRLTGFEVLESLPAHYQPYLIIVSAHDNHALTAFEHAASDYLVKPFSQQRFDKAFQKAYDQWHQRQMHQNYAAIASLGERMAQMLEAQDKYKSRISIKDGAKIVVVPCEDIFYIEAAGDYTTLYTTDKKHLHSSTLSTLEAALHPQYFVRIHRSCIVNVRYIKELISHYNGDYTVALTDGRRLKLSRSYREQLLRILG